MMRRPFYYGIVCLFVIANLKAQQFNFIRKINPFLVKDQSGVPYPFPFLGGLNAPRPQFIDIDGDNDPDLFLQENASELIFFENIGSGTNYQFQWVTNTYNNIDIDEWYRFVDMDADADYDLLTARPLSLIRYYRNDGTVTSPNFVLAADTLRDVTDSPIPAEPASIPVLRDIDGDGDLDLFIGRQIGSVSYFANEGIDMNNVPRFEFVTDTFQGIVIIGGAISPKTRAAQQNSLHGANSLEFVDIDCDHDFDLFWGDFFSRSIYFLENTGDSLNPHLERTFDEYPPTNPLSNGGWNVPRFCDIDADGDLDMFIGEIGGAFSTALGQIYNFYYYENTGSQQNPSFIQRTNQLIRSLDIGKQSIPALVDIDADGDLDMFIAAVVDPNDPFNSSLNFFENIGTPTSPEFELVDTDYLNLNFGYNYSPTFADIDADGDQDLFIGKYSGEIYFLENTGTASSPNFPSVVAHYENIDVGNNSTPAFVDIDADNDLDLFIGEYNGNINFFENTGDSSSANFVSITDSFLNINVISSFPFFTDIDGDVDFDLILGSGHRPFILYRNTGTPQTPNFIEEPAFDLYSPLNNTPILADIDDDTDLDLFSGSLGGGLVFYENMDSATAIANHENQNIPISIRLHQNYPNPFNPFTTIRYELSTSQYIELNIYNLAGQKVRMLVKGRQAASSYEVGWDGKNDAGTPLPSGFYFCQLNGHSMKISRKMLLIR